MFCASSYLHIPVEILIFAHSYIYVQPKRRWNYNNMSISKTRQKLVDVARQLFAKNGVANTTMNDIALASGKGRRTLYTYFNRKEDVYYAVIESELERLSDKLDEVAAKKIRPQDKIIELIYTHLSMIKETVVRNGNLRAEFFRNIWMVEKVRKNFDEDEIELFRKVYSEGKADGEFDIEVLKCLSSMDVWDMDSRKKRASLLWPRSFMVLWASQASSCRNRTIQLMDRQS